MTRRDEQNMINDGYTRKTTITDRHGVKRAVLYRPSPKNERVQYRWLVSGLCDNVAESVSDDWLAKHLVAWDWSTSCGSGEVRHLRMTDFGSFASVSNAIQGLVADDSGEKWSDVEQSLADNLREGLRLEIENPRLARRDCGDCKKYWYAESGLVILNSDKSKMLRDGPTACETKAGCPKGTPENQRTLMRCNLWARLHFDGCVATGNFPDDAIVTKNARIIRSVLESHRARTELRQEADRRARRA